MIFLGEINVMNNSKNFSKQINSLKSNMESRFDNLDELLRMVLISNLSLTLDVKTEKNLFSDFDLNNKDMQNFLKNNRIKIKDKIVINEFRYLILEIEGQINIGKLCDINEYMKDNGQEIIFLLKNISNATRAALLKNGINYIIDNKEIKILTWR